MSSPTKMLINEVTETGVPLRFAHMSHLIHTTSGCRWTWATHGAHLKTHIIGIRGHPWVQRREMWIMWAYPAVSTSNPRIYLAPRRRCWDYGTPPHSSAMASLAPSSTSYSEIMRQQMRVTEHGDARLRKT